MIKLSTKHTLYPFIDVDECDLGRHDCSTNARCFNTPGSFDCVCNPLYMGDGRTCQGDFTSLLATISYNDSTMCYTPEMSS